MKNYYIFLKKELFESFKTYKLFVMITVFFILGIMSPLLAKMTPEIAKWALEYDSPWNLEEDDSSYNSDVYAALFATEPTAFESWGQFYSNVAQMGLIALVIVFSGMLSSELSKGTLTIILTKGLSRGTVILSKLTSAVLIWTASLAAAFLTAWGYTVYLFTEEVSNMFFSLFCLWLFGVFLLALTSLAAALSSKSYVCMIMVGAVAAVLGIINIIPQAGEFNPITLSMVNTSLITGAVEPKELLSTIAVTAAGIAAATVFSILIFGKRKL